MTIKETHLMIGVAIISELHEYFKEQRNMERDHIINIIEIWKDGFNI